MTWQERITADPAVCHGKPCIRGTRVIVSVVLDNLADGESVEAIMLGYRIEREDVQAAIQYAAELARDGHSLHARRGLMRFKIDENLHDDVRALLAGRGHDVHTVHDEGLRGCDDSSLALHCLNDHRALVTLDLDFADIRTFPPADCAGFVVLRVSRQSRRHVLDVVTSALPSLETKPIIGRLWIVTDSSVRIRGE